MSEEFPNGAVIYNNKTSKSSAITASKEVLLS
jgi:hypothetical protein